MIMDERMADLRRDRDTREPGSTDPDPVSGPTRSAMDRLLQAIAANATLIKVVVLIAFVLLTLAGLRAVYVVDVKAITTVIQQHAAVSLIVFIFIFVALTILLLPTLPVSLLAGALWGALLGGVVCAFATGIAACLCVVLGRRFLGQATARHLLGRHYDFVTEEFERNGNLIVALFRLNPIFPAAVNYAFAFMPISAIRFGVLSFLFALPIGVAIAGIGEISSVAVLEGTVPDMAQWGISGLSAAVTVISLIWVVRIRRSSR